MFGEFLIKIIFSVALVSFVMIVFFSLLRKNMSSAQGNEGTSTLNIVAQTRVGLKAQLVLVESDNRRSLIAFSGDEVVPIWTDKIANSETINGE